MSKPKIEIKDDCAELRVNSDIYSKEVIFAVGYHYLDKAYILLDSEDGEIIVHIFPQQPGTDLKQFTMEFCNEMLNYGHYFSRLQNNSEAIKSIMQRALFSAAPSLVQEAEEQEIEDLIRELEAEEEEEGKNESSKKSADAASKRKQ